MIDWVSFVAPCVHSKQITGGLIASVRTDGTVEWSKFKRHVVRGSWDTAMTIRSVMTGCDPCTRIEVSGNPVKWFQGHNLWGTDDLPALVVALLDDLALRTDLGLTPTAWDRERWAIGAVGISRVDVTESFHLRNRPDVLAWLRAAEQSAHLSHRGRGQLCKGSTLYFGKNSRRWSLKLYSKGQEVEAVGHGQDAILRLPAALEWADRSLRAEMVIRSMELKRRGLSMLCDWACFQRDDVDSEVTAQLLRPVLGDLTMTTKTTLSADVLESLTNAQRTAFFAWQAGHDLRSVMTRRSFYRMRSLLLPHGIDIAVPQLKEPSNVVPLVRVLEAVPARVPEWAHGTPLYFEPPRVRVA